MYWDRDDEVGEKMIKGKIHKFGDNINTDDIIPAVYLVSTDEKELAEHCFQEYSPAFGKKMKPGDVIVAGDNFGCGSSREHAPRAIKGIGVSCVVAKSFARIFYRNAVNIGLPILECPDIVKETGEGDTVEIDFVRGTVKNLSAGKEYRFSAYPEFLQKLISAGGLMNYALK